MEIRIERAEIDDLELLMEWRERVLREVFSLPADDAMAALMAENRAYYRSELPRGGHIACFAYEGEAVVGCGGICLHREMPSPDNNEGKCGYLMNIYTVAEQRRRGIGGAIVAWLIAQARERGVSKIFLEATPRGKGLYREIGFVDMKDYMLLK